jgi:nitroimidazol reductase NimA-like FMN-containing flavoprotein (pyridoxamine 5'-phosphate oxidase superfamily)
MSETRGVQMSPEEVDAFLARGGTGVLSLARGDEPYATPVSYGYDRDSRQFFLRLGFGESSEKREFVESTGGARLVAYGPVGEGWTSVVAAGRLVPVDDEALTVETASALREAELPLLSIWGEELDDVEFRIYRLDVEELTGRTTAGR